MYDICYILFGHFYVPNITAARARNITDCNISYCHIYAPDMSSGRLQYGHQSITVSGAEFPSHRWYIHQLPKCKFSSSWETLHTRTVPSWQHLETLNYTLCYDLSKKIIDDILQQGRGPVSFRSKTTRHMFFLDISQSWISDGEYY